MRTEVGSHIFTAGEVAALPVVIATGQNQGVYTPLVGMARTPSVDVLKGAKVVCWMERGAAVICGTTLHICGFTGETGREWLHIKATGVCGNGQLVRLDAPTDFTHGVCFLIAQSCVAAGDELRWRISYGT
jgi:hypothetical protein